MFSKIIVYPTFSIFLFLLLLLIRVRSKEKTTQRCENSNCHYFPVYLRGFSRHFALFEVANLHF